jgi:sugar transferase (PEP-CTERM system associated)
MFRLFGQYVPVKSLILAITESALIIVSFWLAAWVRLGDVDALTSQLDEGYYLAWKLGAVVVICVICFYFNDLYDLQVVARRAELLTRLAQSLGMASLILALLYYLIPQLMFGRGVSAWAALTTGIVLVGWRLVVDAAGKFFRPEQRILVAGTGAAGIRLVRELIEHPELNFKVLGFLDERGENIGKRLVNPGIIGGLAELEEVVRKDRVDRVVLSIAERRGQMPVEKLLRIKFSGTRVEDAHSLYEKLTGQIMLERLTPSWLILSDGFRQNSVQILIKRIADTAISSFALIIFLPLAVLISLAIYLESGKPILFQQERVGLKGRRFQMLKFRSMCQNADKGGPAWASPHDQRITRVGRLLRRYRLDEVPQFINVLQGDMSIVGPRPEQPGFVNMLEAQIPYYAQRHTVRPGITGWAQIKYQYGSSTDDAIRKLEYELFYIKHMSISFDLLIIFRTVQVVLFGAGAI